MSKIFQFKQFSVDQTDCGMKVNTDAALIGALAETTQPGNILEIGTGTGVIALMVAQRYPHANIDAVEIDEKTAQTAGRNFSDSPFANIRLIYSSFEQHFLSSPDKKYDLIVSNPPYFINSLKSANPAKLLARHTDPDFFQALIAGAAEHLAPNGSLYLILPLDTAAYVDKLVAQSLLHITKMIQIHSFPESKPYRCILVIQAEALVAETQKFVIYETQNVYTSAYQQLLKDYLTIF